LDLRPIMGKSCLMQTVFYVRDIPVYGDLILSPMDRLL
jgi:hypothetical protein